MKSQCISSSPVCRTLSVRPSLANDKSTFTDGHLSTQRQIQLVRNIIQYPTLATSQMKKVIQRASPDEWFDGIFHTPGPKTITVYSHILSDGYGDAGQLGNAVHELNCLKTAGIVQDVIPYASYTQSKSGTTEDDWRRNIINLCPELQYLHKTRNEISGWIPDCYKFNNWELQFPVPAPSQVEIDSKRMLHIFEMGMSGAAVRRYNEIYSKIYPKSTGPLYHTGNAPVHSSIPNQDVGYVIPSYGDEERFQALNEVVEVLKLSENTGVEALKDYLNKAWFVKLNNPEYAVNVLKMALEENAELVILQGNLSDAYRTQYENADKKLVYYAISQRISPSCLNCLLACIGSEGRIYAGGEGMLVQALGISNAMVGLIPQDGDSYDYQPQQLLEDVKNPSNLRFYERPIVFNPAYSETMKLQNQQARTNSFFARYLKPRLDQPASGIMRSTNLIKSFSPLHIPRYRTGKPNTFIPNPQKKGKTPLIISPILSPFSIFELPQVDKK